MTRFLSEISKNNDTYLEIAVVRYRQPLSIAIRVVKSHDYSHHLVTDGLSSRSHLVLPRKWMGWTWPANDENPALARYWGRKGRVRPRWGWERVGRLLTTIGKWMIPVFMTDIHWMRKYRNLEGNNFRNIFAKRNFNVVIQYHSN